MCILKFVFQQQSSQTLVCRAGHEPSQKQLIDQNKYVDIDAAQQQSCRGAAAKGKSLLGFVGAEAFRTPTLELDDEP